MEGWGLHAVGLDVHTYSEEALDFPLLHNKKVKLKKPQELPHWAKPISGKTRQEIDEVIRRETAEQNQDWTRVQHHCYMAVWCQHTTSL